MKVVLEAEAEAKRFLKRVDALKKAIAEAEPDHRARYPNLQMSRTYVGAENAAMKRASMDLSRSLAAVRKRET